jgi:transcriptional antiterminator RfaH
MPFWCCARLEPTREHVAEHFLSLAGYQTYLPRLRQRRRRHGRLIETRPLLFPAYGFITIENGWHTARWSIGVCALLMNGDRPAVVPDAIIAQIRAREGRDGLIQLAPAPRFQPGAPVRVVAGPMTGLAGLYAGQRPHERVAILLTLLGTLRRVELGKDDVEPAEGRP